MRQVEQGPQPPNPLLARPAIIGAKHPFHFQQRRRGQQEILIDRLVGQRGLNRIVADEKPNDDVRVESASQTRFPRLANIWLTASSISSNDAGGPLCV